jgi:biotin carboxylase
MIGETLKGFAGKFGGIKQENKGCAAIRFVQTGEGTVSAINGMEDASRMQGVIRVDIGIKVGDKAKESRHSAERPGYVLATGATRNCAIENVDAALRMIAVEVA